MARNKEKKSITEEVSDKRREEAEFQTSLAAAEQAVPALKRKAAALIAKHVSPPPVRKVTIVEMLQIATRDSIRGDTDRFDTKLIAVVSKDQAAIEVRVASTRYPREGNEVDSENVDYRIVVEGLDHYFFTEDGFPYVESTETKSTAPEDIFEVVIGKSYPSVPIWERPATLEELQRFDTLLDELEGEGVTFSGSSAVELEITDFK